MDAKTCLKKMQLVGVLNVATVDEHGAPQIRCISAVHYDEDSLYFFTARGKNVAKELLTDGRVQILVYTKFKEMIRLPGKALPVADERQKTCIDTIFAEQPYLGNLYPGEKRNIGICFEIKEVEIMRTLLKVNGYIFSDSENANEIEDKLFDWLQEQGYYFTGMIDKEDDNESK